MIIIATFKLGCHRGCGLSHRSGSTVHDQHTPVAIPQHRSRPTLLSHRHRPRGADSDRQRRLRPAKPGASNTRSLWRSHPGRPRPASRWSLNPRRCLEPTNQIKHRRQIPIARHHRRREPPAVSSLEAFRTPASVQPLAPVSGRHPKTLNDSGRSPEHDRSAQVDPNPTWTVPQKK